MSMKPDEAVAYLRGQAKYMETLATVLRTKNADMVPTEIASHIIDQLLTFCADLAEQCGQSKRITAGIVEAFSNVATFELYSLDDMMSPIEENAINEMSGQLAEPPFESDFFSLENHKLDPDEND